MQIAYFKRHQENNIYHYFKVVGGPGKTKNGYQEVLNFLNDTPLISIEYNDLSQLTVTWCQYEVGLPISREEYEAAFQLATKGNFEII